ncbi:putative acetyltransferase [Hamadaea flava]|uniref:GNAT family N-acetyltransferase n=1 Tax=Hamadaea flava TaxID=1742688 RepID=A0ABV8LLB4_9ACTN|nr:N-acetyltransferase [Hamadaea flava]MCP2324502.1 putative acetyltransferase [Hamadaea flava]
MIVRRELPADQAAVRAVIAAAFTRDGGDPIEARLLDELREDAGWLPRLSLVAVDGDEVVGYVVCTRGRVTGDHGDLPVLGLGPIGVRPDRQGRGIGQALVHAVLGAADALDEPLVALLGSPAFYGRFGFRRSTDFEITPPEPDWGEYFQVRPLTADAPMPGVFRYAASFEGL